MTRLLCLLLGLAIAGPAVAEPLVFEGRIEASERAVLSSRLNGVVSEVLFDRGDLVSAGQPLIRLDPVDAELALAVAEARLTEARARLDEATRNAERQEALHARGIAPEATIDPVRSAKAMAEAAVALAEAERARAALDLDRTTIRAPIAGFVSRPDVAVGTFLEAEAGPPLATVLAIDPAIVAYQAPYADRLASLEQTGAATVQELLSRVRVTLRLPGDRIYPLTATPYAASAEIDPETGAVTVWASFDNPDALLRPGMGVTVISEFVAP